VPLSAAGVGDTLALAAAVVVGAMVLLWLVSLAARDASIVDIFWGPGFVAVAWAAFAWATESGVKRATTQHVEPFRQHSVEVDFNQDLPQTDDVNQDGPTLEKGTRVRHKAFGDGTVVARRGDVVTIQFDNGKKKDIALNIAPLQVIGS